MPATTRADVIAATKHRRPTHRVVIPKLISTPNPLERRGPAYVPVRTWVGVFEGLALFPKAQASMLPSGGLYDDAPSVL